MKKCLSVFACLLSFLLLFSVCGCKGKEIFFEQSVLKASHVPDLPHLEYEKAKKKYSRIYCFSVSEEVYERYVVMVYEYLSSLNFRYFGTQGAEESGELFMSPSTYEFIPCSELPEFQKGKGYIFVWANSVTEKNVLIQKNYLEIIYDDSLEYPLLIDLSFSIGATYRLIEK